MFQLDEAMDWRQALREQRKARGFTQTRLAREASLSLSALKQYETGHRHPSPEALDAIIGALGLTAEQSSAIRAGAGFAPDMKRIFYERLGPYELRDLEDQISRYPWPVFVTNIAADIMAANRPFFRMLGDELEAAFRADPARRNFISVASDPLFADRVRNWDDCMRFFIGLMKGETRWEHNVERPAPLIEGSFRRFLDGDPRYVRRTLLMYESAPVVRHTTRIDYRIEWTMDDGRDASFRGLIHVADLYQELVWHDWLPDDPETFGMFATGR